MLLPTQPYWTKSSAVSVSTVPTRAPGAKGTIISPRSALARSSFIGLGWRTVLLSDVASGRLLGSFLNTASPLIYWAELGRTGIILELENQHSRPEIID